jgi:hypothetical protein
MLNFKDLDPMYFQDDWGGNDEKAISRLVWGHAVDIFRMFEKVYFKERNKDLCIPCFIPSANGSIDISLWAKGKYSLLINIDTDDNVDYFGVINTKDNYCTIRGNSTNPADLYYLGYWLANS